MTTDERAEAGAPALEGGEENPVVRDAVDQAVAPLVGKVTPEYLAWVRTALADMLTMHPYTSDLIRSLQDRPAQQRSGTAAVEEEDGRQAASIPSGKAAKAAGDGK